MRYCTVISLDFDICSDVVFFFLCESYFSYIHVESNFTSNKLAAIWDTTDKFWSEKLCLTKGHQRPLPTIFYYVHE